MTSKSQNFVKWNVNVTVVWGTVESPALSCWHHQLGNLFDEQNLKLQKSSTFLKKETRAEIKHSTKGGRKVESVGAKNVERSNF